MARQDGRETVHFDPGDGFPVCGQTGAVLVTTDPDAESDDFTLCGRCMRQPRWRLAWKDAARKVSVP
jgi:hypothetical protein